MLDLKVFSGNI